MSLPPDFESDIHQALESNITQAFDRAYLLGLTSAERLIRTTRDTILAQRVNVLSVEAVLNILLSGVQAMQESVKNGNKPAELPKDPEL